MKTVLAMLLLGFIGISHGQDFSPEGICHWRAELLGSVAQERDRGVSEAQVLRTFYAKMPKLRGSGFEGLVHIAYSKDARGIPPKDLANIALANCLSNLEK